jgi:hypothetical protein
MIPPDPNGWRRGWWATSPLARHILFKLAYEQQMQDRRDDGVRKLASGEKTLEQPFP